MQTAFTVLLAMLTLLAVSLQRTYATVPLKELKRRARGGDELAAGLLKAVAYGHSLRAVLWFLIGLTSAGFFVLVSLTTPTWLALVASVVLVWAGFVWLPSSRISKWGEKLAAWAAPLLEKLLAYINPIIDRIVGFIRSHRPLHVHSGLYERADLLELIEQQQVQPDNRIEKTELEIAKHALSFGDLTIGSRMTPRRAVKQTSADDSLGPVIMDELHASGHSRFPVYEKNKDNIVGTLYLHDLVRSKHGGTVRSLMRPTVYYLHEDQSLHDALQAFLKTHHHLFVVVNSFEEYVGIITSEDILEAILGKPIIDEFDQYEDLRAVAGRAAKQEHQEHTSAEEEKPTADEPEVLE